MALLKRICARMALAKGVVVAHGVLLPPIIPPCTSSLPPPLSTLLAQGPLGPFMQSIQDAPALTLEDIMHTTSPSPVPQPPSTTPDTDPASVVQVMTPAQPKQSFYVQANHSPDLPDQGPAAHAEASAPRSRLQELGLLDLEDTPTVSMSTRERELVDMVCRILCCFHGLMYIMKLGL